MPRGTLLNGTNAAVLKYIAIMSAVLSWRRATSPAVAPGTSSADCPLGCRIPFWATSVPIVNTRGLPDWKRWNPVSVHPFSSVPAIGWVKVRSGLQTHDAATTWRRSRRDGPHSESRSNGFGMLLMSPVVFSGWFVRFLDNAYDADNEK